MKKTIILLFVTVLFYNCTSKKVTYKDEIKLVQYELNRQYSDEKESPLTKEDFKTFKSLDFFEINKKYKVEATLELTPDAPIFEMATTTERLPLFKKYAIAHFILDGKSLQLSLYKTHNITGSMEDEDFLFLPFKDNSNGETSYGGGRFIDLEMPLVNSKTIIIDFNKAYNPYCAYNHKFSCPIPPKENQINVSINAGVKAYGKSH